MVVHSIALVALALLLFLASFVPVDGATWLYASIACCLAAQVLLLVDRRQARVPTAGPLHRLSEDESPREPEPSAPARPVLTSQDAGSADVVRGDVVEDDAEQVSEPATVVEVEVVPATADAAADATDESQVDTEATADEEIVDESKAGGSRDAAATIVRPRRQRARPVVRHEGLDARRLQQVAAQEIIARRRALEPSDAPAVVRPQRTEAAVAEERSPAESRAAVRRRAALRRAAAVRRAAARGELAELRAADQQVARAAPTPPGAQGRGTATTLATPAAVRAAQVRRAAAARRRAAAGGA